MKNKNDYSSSYIATDCDEKSEMNRNAATGIYYTANWDAIRVISSPGMRTDFTSAAEG
jgi:hypothetical protein